MNRYSHWSGDSGRPNGASGLSITRPCTPPVQSSIALYFRICGIETASANVVSARYSPPSRSAGSPTRNPTQAHTIAETGNVAQYGTFHDRHQDRRGIGADRIERAVPQRNLPVEAGQQRQAQNGDGIDHAPS